MPSQIPFEQHRKLLHYIAHKVMRRVHAAGAKTVQMEDIFQELCIAWCKARDRWEPEHQVPFGPYLMRGMSNHINRWADHELDQHHIAPFDLDAELTGYERAGTLHDVTADTSQASAEDVLIEKDLREYIRDPMRWKRGLRAHEPMMPETERFLELMDNPPPSVMKVLNGLRARAEYGREKLGIPSTFAPTRMTGAFVMDIMGVDRKGRKAIYQQIERMSDRVSQQ